MEIQKLTDNLFYLIFIGTAGSILLTSSVIYFYIQYYKKTLAQHEKLQQAIIDHRKHLLQVTIQSQESERAKISQDLHDHIGSALSNLRYMIPHLQNAAPDVTAMLQISQEYKAKIDSVIEDVRNISHNLSPAGLSLWGLRETIEEYCENTSVTSGIKIEVSDYSDNALDQLDFTTSLALYRVIQELIANTIKHADAKTINIKTSIQNNHLTIHYCDDGKGIGGAIFSHSGIGMYNIESRLAAIDARHEASQPVHAGYSFTIILAYQPQKQTKIS